MASKKELKAAIAEMCDDLGLNVDTDGMNHSDLSELSSDLKAKVKDAKHFTKADEAEKKRYLVVEGKALTTKRGVKAGGEEVTPKDVNGGEEVLKKLVKSGHLIKA